MKKFFGTLMIVAGAVAAGGLFLVIFAIDSDEALYPLSFGALALTSVGLALVGRHLYRAGGEGPKARRFYGALLILIGVVYAAAALLWPFYFILESERNYYNINKYNINNIRWDPIYGSCAILSVLGIILVILGTKKFCLAGLAPGQAADSREDAGAPRPAEPTAAVCPACGRRYPLTQVYCEECGALLEKRS